MNMIDAVQSCLRQYFGFTGRARRSEFWYWVLATYIGRLVLYLLNRFFPVLDGGGLTLSAVYSIFIFLPGFAVTVRRLHDTGRSGWWIVGFWFFLFIIFIISIGVTAHSIEAGQTYPGSQVLLIVLMILAFIYAVALFIFLVTDSQSGPNDYGRNLKEHQNFDIFN